MTREEMIALARKKRSELDAMAAKASEMDERWRFVANAFSASIWKILPRTIKVLFEEYRDARD